MTEDKHQNLFDFLQSSENQKKLQRQQMKWESSIATHDVQPAAEEVEVIEDETPPPQKKPEYAVSTPVIRAKDDGVKTITRTPEEVEELRRKYLEGIRWG
jgi:hypothetical protein